MNIDIKKTLSVIFLLYIFLFVCGSVFAVGERTISLGGRADWNSAETRTGISEAGNVRPFSVLLLSSAPQTAGGYAAAGLTGNFSALTESVLDLSVSFDEREAGLFRDSTGMYKVRAPVNVDRTDRTLARAGEGAALFGRSGGGVVIEPQSRNALFAPGKRIGDFTVEFWLYPFNMENGEKIFSWASSVSVNGNNVMQRIQCIASRNRLQWSFVNFFADPGFGFNGGASVINLEFSGNVPVVPKTWSHHLVRFDAKTGMIEYLVDGKSDAISYATRTRRESSEVFTPITGNTGAFLIGESFTGFMDELKILSVYSGRSSVRKYASGRMETRAIDLGDDASSIVRLDVSGGRTGPRLNEFRENGRFRFSDDTQLNFFIRSGENPWLLYTKEWVNFTPGEDISGIQGRYVQIAADFYSSADGETSPYLEQINIIYLPGESPLPPRNLTAVAVDGRVQLRWRHSPDINTNGYLVYYSTVRGELFGTDAAEGASPIDAGMTNNIMISGLENGTLYYFRVAGYSRFESTGKYNVGEFSAEVTARPLKQ